MVRVKVWKPRRNRVQYLSASGNMDGQEEKFFGEMRGREGSSAWARQPSTAQFTSFEHARTV